MTFRTPIEKYIYTTMNTENPLWISFSGDSESIYDNSNVDAFTSEKPCVAGSIPALSTSKIRYLEEYSGYLFLLVVIKVVIYRHFY